jgi:hypothetical protein
MVWINIPLAVSNRQQLSQIEEIIYQLLFPERTWTKIA